jgi:hypothetical protein
MNWATPCAPARLMAPGRKLLSRQINRVKKSTGMRWVVAAVSIIRHSAWSIVSLFPCARATGPAATLASAASPQVA